MEFNSTSQYFRHKNPSYEKKSLSNLNKSRSIIVRIPKSNNNDNFRTNNFTYRTEVYLQQREKQYIEKSSSATITTWKNLKYQKQILDNDQVEIDRVLSTLDSIHKTFNRSLLIPYNKVYSSLYGNHNNKSDRLMKTFCQCRNHYMTYELSMKLDDDDNNDADNNDNDDESKTQVISNSFGNFQDTDLDDTTDNEEERENENEKKKSYDSGYGSVIPMKQYSREPFIKITQPWNVN
ncbi:unnamed protein product [Rotaria sordida]|uniref:Uncharacterized protein n=1 Tax=Rotaria sordida TaxID=392033 RepID=A0A818MJA8_9BILA|nr:unnamed protein product [Rotaria sordida]CAF0989133.1 unnamed protein product [Rotaria sordida]CAF0989822.1 unnamed protein product [Rotaria sordida]CAF1055492.1 unnamed protein product [Rotaria sordida]CAF1225047.1 unnamed protein product [Rotaria sordida]